MNQLRGTQTLQLDAVGHLHNTNTDSPTRRPVKRVFQCSDYTDTGSISSQSPAQVFMSSPKISQELKPEVHPVISACVRVNMRHQNCRVTLFDRVDRCYQSLQNCSCDPQNIWPRGKSHSPVSQEILSVFSHAALHLQKHLNFTLKDSLMIQVLEYVTRDKSNMYSLQHCMNDIIVSDYSVHV